MLNKLYLLRTGFTKPSYRSDKTRNTRKEYPSPYESIPRHQALFTT